MSDTYLKQQCTVLSIEVLLAPEKYRGAYHTTMDSEIRRQHLIAEKTPGITARGFFVGSCRCHTDVVIQLLFHK